MVYLLHTRGEQLLVVRYDADNRHLVVVCVRSLPAYWAFLPTGSLPMVVACPSRSVPGGTVQHRRTITMFCFIAARGCIAASQSGNVKCNKLSLNCSDKTTTLLLLRQLMQVSFEEGFYHNRQLLRNRSSTLRTQRKKTAAAVSKAIVCFLWADSVRFVGCSLLRGHAPKANTQFF